MPRKPSLPALLLAGLVLSGPGALQSAPPDRSATAAGLHALFEAEWERGLREEPVGATYVGDTRYNDRWPDRSPAAIAAAHEADLAALRRLDALDPARLSAADRLNRDLFRRQTQGSIDSFDYGSQYLPLSHRGGLPTLHRLADVIVFREPRDYEQWLTRMRTLDVVVDENVALMREGVRRGLVPPKVLIQRLPKQIDRQIVQDPTRSPFYDVFRDMPASIPAAERSRLQAAARAAISGKIVPAYTRLKAYVEQDYLPACRDTVGLWDSPNGEQRYAELARWYTTTDLTPAQIHELGLQEVARIRAEMLQVIARTGFKGSFEEFLQYLRTDPKFHYTDP
ncbi:MAG: DUF885 domain-containing protein, partial [Steroidobacteraceae bacterium]